MPSESTTVGDLDDDRTVYYTSRTGGSDRSIHLDEDCWHLEDPVWDKPARKLQDHREVCLECVGESPTGGPEKGTCVTDTRDLLLATDADDVGRETAEDGDLVTDGGQDWFTCVCGARYRSRRAVLRCCGERLEEKRLIPDGGRETTRYRVVDDRPAISYGPRSEDEWVLALTTEQAGRVEIVLGEEPMYDLWVETRGVPWPNSRHETEERGRLVKQVVHAANDADEEMLRDALEALGVRR